ncbi:MAG: hypothetical protein E7644_04930 [Ruminococcaceae bacterium]|nr:hypothetical protein [Oscillospiraceae bacterium]
MRLLNESDNYDNYNLPNRWFDFGGPLVTTKKYVLTFVIFALLLVLTMFLLFSGLFIKEQSEFAFYTFIVCSCICLIVAIIYIAINYKKLINYDINKINKKIANLNFSIFDISISESELYDKLTKCGYKIKKGIFHKEVEENCGDGSIVNRYCVIINKTNELVDIQAILEHFSKGMTTYNIGYIFVNENIEENIEIIKKYIKATILDVKVHPYKYKHFFVPIVIANDKIYYIKESGILMNMYGFGVVEGVHIINNK